MRQEIVGAKKSDLSIFGRRYSTSLQYKAESRDEKGKTLIGKEERRRKVTDSDDLPSSLPAQPPEKTAGIGHTGRRCCVE